MRRWWRTATGVWIATVVAWGLSACGQPAGGPSPAAGEPYQVGIAVKDITPTWPTYLSSAVDVLVSDHYSALKVKAMVIHSEGESVAIVTADVTGFCEEVSQPIYDRVASLGLGPHQIVLNASHSHTVPAVCDVHDVLDVTATPITRYQAFFIDQVVSAIAQAGNDMRPAVLGISGDESDICINWDGPPYTPGWLIPNPDGIVDRRVRLLQVKDPGSDEPRAILSLFSCHPSDVASRDGKGAFGSEFFGFGRDHVKRHYPGLIVLTAQGVGGDAGLTHFVDDDIERGFARSFPDDLDRNREFGEEFGAAIIRALDNQVTPVAGPIRAAVGSVRLPVEAPPSRDFIAAAASGEAAPDNQPGLTGNPWYRRWAKWMLSRYEAGTPFPETVGPYDIRVIRFGSDFSLIALNGEVQTCVGLKAERRLAPEPTFVLGFSNNTKAYIPCAENFDPPQSGGSYPISVYYWWLWQTARLRPGVDTVIIDEITRLAEELGHGTTPADAKD